MFPQTELVPLVAQMILMYGLARVWPVLLNMTKKYYLAHREEILARNRAKVKTAEQIEASKARCAKYDKSEKAKAKRVRYYQSEKGKATLARHDAKRKDAPARILKNQAQRKVAYAIKKGVLTKEPCACCGDMKVVGHHHFGYGEANILNVKWLCQKHHTEAHQIIKYNEALPTN